MYNLPSKLQNFTPYTPLVGDYKIRLDVNESFIEIPQEIVLQAVETLEFNRYPDPYAAAPIAAFVKLFGGCSCARASATGVGITADNVTAGNGSDELIGLIAAGLLQKGARVLVFTPDFSMYGFYSRLYELEVIEMPKSAGLNLDLDEVMAFVKENKDNRVDCIMFSNPCNPTSLGIDKAEMMRFAEGLSALSNSPLLVIDEAYMDFWDESQSMLNAVNRYDNLVVLRTCSKSVALASIRLGFAVSNERITSALKAIKSPFNVNALTQAIGAAILSNAEYYKKSIALIKESAAALRLGLKELELFERIYDNKANFVFVQTDKAEQIYEHLLTKGIAVRCFAGHLRICAGTFAENNQLIKELRAWKTQIQ